jgi:hypothetical protein
LLASSWSGWFSEVALRCPTRHHPTPLSAVPRARNAAKCLIFGGGGGIEPPLNHCSSEGYQRQGAQ